MVDVFVCYRSADVRFGAAATYELLAHRLGRERIFLDNQSMTPGSVFPEMLRGALSSMRVLLVLMGPQWGAADPRFPGRALIEADDDWVRTEIRTGLSRGVHVVPVLLDGAALPSATELPPDVRGVVERQVVEVRHRHLGADIAKLADAIEVALGEPRPPASGQRTRDTGNPLALGVHASPMRPGIGGLIAAQPLVPLYVPRDADAALRWAVSATRFVLVVGDAMAGKSRSAYEAVRDRLPDHRLIAPNHVVGLAAAVESTRHAGKCVLWLDDFARFLVPGGLTPAVVVDLARRDVVLVGTIRGDERTAIADRGREGGRDVVRFAYEIHIARRWTAGEVSRAASSGDHRVRDAARHADNSGVAEYLAAGPQLLAKWRDAWTPGSHPRAAAVVAAAVDAFRAGTRRGLAARALRRLHHRYLVARGGRALRPEPFDEALAWATQAVHAPSGLLVPIGRNRYRPFGYLVDAVDAESSIEANPLETDHRMI